MATTAERLKEIIEIRNIKQVELMERTGISKGALSSYLSGRYIPKQENVYKLAKALGVNPAWLMGRDVPMEIDKTPMNYDGSQYDPGLIDRAIHFLEAYDNANPDIQNAIQSLLKVSQSDS